MDACPWCGAELGGLGRFCNTCNRYTDEPQQQESASSDLRAQAKSEPAAQAPSRGRQVLVLPLISQNRMWGIRALVVRKDRLFQGVQDGNWRMIMSALSARMYVTHEGQAFQKDAAAWLAAQHAFKMEGNLRCKLTLYLPRRIGDADNYTKPIGDALEGVVVTNDKQFSEWHIVRRYDKVRPRSVLVIEPDDESTVLDPGATFNYEMAF